ncbi:MAG: Gfo/Idh/MocA family oxidoreductase [SAR202 cluster bacterium]|nr:Gfo/Idh/MocA family oxidoreductase [SAR202 cluster bacterium]
MVNGNSRPFTVGFISSPHPHARLHVKTLDVLPQVEAVHVCGLEGEDVEGLRAQAPGKVKSTGCDLAEILAMDEIDALIVCVRNDLSPAVLEAAVEAGKPVLFEKPGALTAPALQAVAEKAQAKKLTMGVMLQWRGHPICQEVRNANLGGALGRIMTVESRIVTSQVRYRDPKHWLFNKAHAGSGILSWLACHHIDTLCYLMGDRVAEVSAMVGQQNVESIDVEDTAFLSLRFASGAMGTVHAGYHLVGSKAGYSGAAYDTFLALRGTDGYVRMPLSDEKAYMLSSIAPGWAAGGKRERSFTFPDSPAYGGVAGEDFVMDFLNAAREGRPALAPIEGMVHVLEVIDAALESSKTGRVVTIGAGPR